MANGRNKGSKGDSGRDAGGFVAIPWSVLDSSAYARLSHPARSLLMEFARQFAGNNNGKLLCSAAYLSKRGWKSNDVISRAKRELISAGFIHETCKGCRPNKASWYAVTWRVLDKHVGYDAGAAELFVRGAYRKNDVLKPSRGAGETSIAPSRGVVGRISTPSRGAMGGVLGTSSTPSHGDHLEMPSADAICLVDPAQQAIDCMAQLWAKVGSRSNWAMRGSGIRTRPRQHANTLAHFREARQ